MSRHLVCPRLTVELIFVFHSYRKKKRAVKMMITIVLLFTICWAPFHTVHMLFEYCKCLSMHGGVMTYTTFTVS